jgi:hypothetical protein
VLIEPWYMIAPIGAAGDAWLRRMTDGRSLVGDHVSLDVDDAIRARARRKNLEWWFAWELDDGPMPEDYAAGIGVKDPETASGRWRGTGLNWPLTTAQINEIEAIR